MHVLQVLIPKDPTLLGKMFEVDITITGKHFLKGRVVKNSLLHVVPRPLPLSPGHVSGVQSWKSKKLSLHFQQHQPPIKKILGGLDIILLTIAAVIVSLALFIRFVHHNNYWSQ